MSQLAFDFAYPQSSLSLWTPDMRSHGWFTPNGNTPYHPLLDGSNHNATGPFRDFSGFTRLMNRWGFGRGQTSQAPGPLAFPSHLDVPAAGSVKRPPKPKRTGIPFVDGLIGVESNPGPRKRGNKGKSKQPRSRSQKGRGMELNSSTRAAVTAPAAVYGGRPRVYTAIDNAGRRSGKATTVVRGCLIIGSYGTTSDQKMTFRDLQNGVAKVQFINPRALGVAAPSDDTPDLIALHHLGKMYREFMFTKLAFHYVPVAVATTNVDPLAMAFTADFCDGTMDFAAITLATIESSIVGPVWSPATLDVTRFLDTSRWFKSEINTPPNTDNGYLQYQGSLIFPGATTSGAASANWGFIYVEYEVHLLEMASDYIGTGPLLRAQAEAAKAKAAAAADDDDSRDIASTVYASSSSSRSDPARKLVGLRR